MTADQDPEQLRRLFTSNEPQGIRTYLAVPEEGRRYHIGTTVPLIGAFVQLGTGLWVPEGARVAPAPLDFASTYVALSEVTSGLHIGLDCRVARGIAAPGSHRTERDSLPSFRSSHPSVRNRSSRTSVRTGWALAERGPSTTAWLS
jgi:hypothetical protein